MPADTTSDDNATNTSQTASAVDGQLRDEALLATLGYKQELMRVFTPWELFGMGFSVMGLFSSMASVLIYVIPNGGASAMVWGWTVCVFFLMFLALALAELGSAAPTSGGLYYWTHSLSSPRYKNVLSWIVGYSNSVGTIASIASVDWGFAVQLMAAASIGSDFTFLPTTGQTYGVYALVLLIHAMVCSMAMKYIARLQLAYTLLNVLLCVGIIVGLPSATPNEFRNSAGYAFGSFENFYGWPNGFAFILSFLAPLWTVGGFDTSVHISEEAKNASIAVPWALISAVAISSVLGWAINVAISFNMGTDLGSIVASPIGQPMAAILFNSFGKRATLAVWSIVIIVQFMMGMNMLTVCSRQIFAFSRDGGLPFSRYLRRVNTRTRTPTSAVWFAAFVSLLLGLLAFAGPQAIGAIFSLVVAGQYVAYAIPISARFLGANKFKKGPFHLGIFSLPVAVIAVAWMSFILFIFFFPTTTDPTAANMNYTVVVWGGVIILSLLYFYFPKYGGRHWFTGPIRTLGDTNASGMGREDDSEKKYDASFFLLEIFSCRRDRSYVRTARNHGIALVLSCTPVSFTPTILHAKMHNRDEELLATLGYKQELRREFSPWELFGISFSIIGVFPSMASVLLYAIPNGGPLAMVWGWAVGLVFVMFIGLAMAELGSAAPTSGGLYYWTHTFSSPRYKNVFAWIVGYELQLVRTHIRHRGVKLGFCCPADGRRQYRERYDPDAYHGPDFVTGFLSRLQTFYIVVNVAICVIIFVGLPAATPQEFKNSAKVAFGDFQNLNGWPDGFAFIFSFLSPLWTFGALDPCIHLSEEASNAAIAVPWAIVSTIVVSGILGWAVNITLAFNMGTDLVSIVENPIGQPMATILFNGFGKRGILGVWSLVVVAQFMIGTGAVTVSARQIFAFSRDGGLPFSRFLRRVSPHTHTPLYAVWAMVLVAILLGLLAFAGPNAISAIFSLGVVAQYIAYTVPIAARFLGKNDFKKGPFHLGIFSLPVAVIAVAFMSFMIIIFTFPTTPNPTTEDMNYTVVVSGGVMILSLAYYFFPKYGGRYWFQGPIRTVEDDLDAGSAARGDKDSLDSDGVVLVDAPEKLGEGLKM
ncbi:hypothetical protein EVG20_g6781 [Dentipellis fragilis]|uniref:Amino acid permease/ SLC12A domain-containing protein n=1 Tax=Dentipellis fragilis TaxID=205917 RepID=A0A4Y9YI53_9AGAM|nr:hypothetical protein EVG20_g6781 [Dentipellis fragilis]